MLTRRRFVLAVALLLPVVVGSATAQDRPAPETEEAAVRRLIQRYVDARELSDPLAIGSLFVADADQLVSDGTWRRGRTALVDGMLESSRKNPAKRTITVETVRFLGPEFALADGRYVQQAAPGGKDRTMWSSFTLRKTADGWRIAAIRNMLPAAP